MCRLYAKEIPYRSCRNKNGEGTEKVVRQVQIHYNCLYGLLQEQEEELLQRQEEELFNKICGVSDQELITTFKFNFRADLYKGDMTEQYKLSPNTAGLKYTEAAEARTWRRRRGWLDKSKSTITTCTACCMDRRRSCCIDRRRSCCYDRRRSCCIDRRRSCCKDRRRSCCMDRRRSCCIDRRRSCCIDRKRSCIDRKRSCCRDRRRSFYRDWRRSCCRDRRRSCCRDRRRSCSTRSVV
ncbi:luc7-like protein 3 [Macrosteles quadrilineatus]|uniref:luc7-like protein 3 n=1 Tax=Macrosteles quadrilineatus TaxID=74068 RepID=UPI0023E2EAA8|nr:luc7-like protein 3 [Macrosteles quadrilineatus]